MASKLGNGDSSTVARVSNLWNGFIYEITYAKGGSSYYFKVFINFKGDTIEIKEKAKKQGAEDIVGAP